MDEKRFRAAVEAAVRDAAKYGTAVVPEIVSHIVSAAEDWASERYQEGRTQGMIDERIVHFG